MLKTSAAAWSSKAILDWGLILVVASSCGGNAGSPAGPTPAPTVTALTIVGPAVVPSGSIAAYTVRATMSDGTAIANATPVAWTTDNANVATVDGQGQLTGHGPGVATITAGFSGKTATAAVRVSAPSNKSISANVEIIFEPDPVPGSMEPCSGAFWGGQTPTWRTLETSRETQGVGFTLNALTYTFYNKDGAVTRRTTFTLRDYFPPNSEEVEDGCMALDGSPSGSFEEILEGIDDNGNNLKFARRLQLLPVPR